MGIRSLMRKREQEGIIRHEKTSESGIHGEQNHESRRVTKVKDSDDMNRSH